MQYNYKHSMHKLKHFLNFDKYIQFNQRLNIYSDSSSTKLNHYMFTLYTLYVSFSTSLILCLHNTYTIEWLIDIQTGNTCLFNVKRKALFLHAILPVDVFPSDQQRTKKT